MPSAATIKPTHKAIQAYYATLEGYSGQRVDHELALRSAFQNLLAETAKSRNWMLIPEQSASSVKVAGRTVRPDGTLRDQNSLPRGYWEAKDSGDDLDAEIKKKTDRGYPLTNTIMLMPYYIAALNIEHAYYELTGQYEPFDGLGFVDTLDMAEVAFTNVESLVKVIS